MAAAAVTSAAPLLALLEEDDDQLKVHALRQLDTVVPQCWFQISNYIPQVEALCEDAEFSHREGASLLASKVFYYLRELDEALHYALGAGAAFDIDDTSDYVSTIVARALDKYFEIQQARDNVPEDAPGPDPIDPRLESIVERMIKRCIDHKQFQHAIGIALEARRFDKLMEAVDASGDVCAALRYALATTKVVVSRTVRDAAMTIIVSKFQANAGAMSVSDWITVCQCLMQLNNADKVATILAGLVASEDDRQLLLAYQIGFDLFDNDVAAFMLEVQAKLKELVAADGAADGSTSAASDGGVIVTAQRPRASITAAHEKLDAIIGGQWPVGLQLEFLYWHNKADLQLLRNIKESFDTRLSMCHSATVMANAFMHAGTTVDMFLRQNLDWLSNATNWARFGATASLGVIHRGHLRQTLDLMKPYLPSEGRTVTPYSEGGALYALGIIHASAGKPVLSFLRESLSKSTHDVVQHGACLGLGLAAQGTNDHAIYDDLKEVLYTDSAVAGEAAGIAMGLLCCGSLEESSDRQAEEMLAYAHDTQHEKIIRGLALGLAVLCYGREEAADGVVEQMTSDGDPILRYGGMFALGMAFRGTDNNGAIQKLLHFAVTDVSDDVRRAAVMNLGFVLLGMPELCPQIVGLLAESYNAHLRYGAAMAVGIACAGTGSKSAEALLKPMLKDRVDFVRQGGNIAMALVMVQSPEERLTEFRKHLESTWSQKHNDPVCKMGAIMAAGILDAGGRNVTIGMMSSVGFFRRTAILAMALFVQYWFWFPNAYMLALAFRPTAFIGLTSDLKLPKMEVVCNCKKGLFAYPKPVADSTKKKVSKLPTAVLSTTKRALARAKRKAESKGAGDVATQGGAGASDAAGATASMDVDDPIADGGADKSRAATAKDAAAGTSGEQQKGADAAGSGEQEDVELCPYRVENPARVTPAQAKYMAIDDGARFQPLKAHAASGILILVDRTPGVEVEYVDKQSSLHATPAERPPSDAANTTEPNGTSEPATASEPERARDADAEPEAPEDMDYTE